MRLVDAILVDKFDLDAAIALDLLATAGKHQVNLVLVAYKRRSQ